MNTSRLADISEIVSSIAILITLIFLTIQMQQNTQAIEATTRQAALDADTQFINQAINHPETVLGWTRPELTDEEAVQQMMSLVLFFRNRENDFIQYRRGVMDEATWQRYISSITATFRYENNRNWWLNYGASAFDPDYVEEINRILERTSVVKVQVQDWYRAILEPPEKYQKTIESLTR